MTAMVVQQKDSDSDNGGDNQGSTDSGGCDEGGVGLDRSKIIAIDAGNCTDVYQFIDFARQYRLEVKRVLQNVAVSRVFTIYQLADLIIHQLPKIIHRFSSRNKILMIYGLFHLFVSDPYIDKEDTERLVSFTHCHGDYEKWLLSYCLAKLIY
jgi:hypothetical protein